MASEAASHPESGSSSRAGFLDATGMLLRRQGYAATGLAEIVARSGAPRGSLYFHFPGGKQQLAVRAMEQEGERLRDAIAATLAASERPGESLALLIDALAAGLERSRYRDGCPIATVTLEAASSAEPIRLTAASVFASWLDVIERRLAASGLDPAAARRRSQLVLAAIEGALILARAERSTGPLLAVRDELRELLG